MFSVRKQAIEAIDNIKMWKMSSLLTERAKEQFTSITVSRVYFIIEKGVDFLEVGYAGEQVQLEN